jgi:hypothetical protein
MKQVIPVSFHEVLASKSTDLLVEEKMECPITEQAIPELISHILNYTEEGKALFPDLYILDDLNFIKKIVPNSQFCFIGNGEKSKETMLKALKKCAPLTENGWAIFILRKEDQCFYGVFRGGLTLLSVSVQELLVEQDNGGLQVVLIHQVANKLVEVKGSLANTILISYGTKAYLTSSPLDSQLEFIRAIVANVDSSLKDQATNFFRKIFLEVLRKGHGTLACVVKSRNKVIKDLSDGHILEQRINIPIAIGALLSNDNLADNSILEGQFSLIVGMMQSDGITVFTDKGEVAAYNVFVKHPQKFAQSKTSGGSRSRTFLTLNEMIGSGLEAAYIQSQDGKIEYKR